ncbi:transcription factor S [Candidatus Woesearchaeota archaeon]|nr:transcription factor S [Candidatus Woesearchaeota archaeon]
MMKFCLKCKSLMLPKKHGSKVVMTCTQCGATDDKVESIVLKEKVKKEGRAIEAIEPDKEETLPVTNERCPKCHNTQAHYWLLQTRMSDEAPTKFLRCTKCRHTWREY